MSALGQSLRIVARRNPLYVCNAPIATKFCRVAECREGPGADIEPEVQNAALRQHAKQLQYGQSFFKQPATGRHGSGEGRTHCSHSRQTTPTNKNPRPKPGVLYLRRGHYFCWPPCWPPCPGFWFGC